MKNLIKYHPVILSLVGTMVFALLLGADQLDPTEPPNANTPQQTAAQPLVVTAIFIYPAYRVAIINGQSLMVGSHVGEFIVTTINPYTVELSGTQGKEVLKLTTSMIKQER